ncbi:hypothetical protein ACUOCP_04490, partial [Escherichia sp. R-CC3]
MDGLLPAERQRADAERIASHKIARSKVSVFLMAMSAGVFMAFVSAIHCRQAYCVADT